MGQHERGDLGQVGDQVALGQAGPELLVEVGQLEDALQRPVEAWPALEQGRGAKEKSR